MTSNRCISYFVAAVTTLTTLQVQAVGTRKFVLDEGKDFEGGELEGVAVDSTGRVRAGFNLQEVPVEGAGAIWSVLRRRDGSVLLGTGSEGKLLSLRGSVVSVLADTDALAITCMAEAWDKVVFGTLPGGIVRSWNGKSVADFAKLEGAGHIWRLAFDARRGVLYAATGPDGKLWRITKDGKAEVYFDAPEQHLVSLAVAADGTVYAGSSDKARLYKITAPGRASVLYDFTATEVREIALAPNGELYAIANEISAGGVASAAKSAAGPSSAGASSSGPPSTKGKGKLYHFTSDGKATEILENKDEHFVSLALGDGGEPYVGTGGEGKLHTVDANRNSVLVADVEQRQISALALAGGTRLIAVSDPAGVYTISGTGGTAAVWTSKVLDAGIRARFGRMRWVSTGTVELATRAGNSAEPDETWSEWSAPMLQAGEVRSPPGRFVQLRARWNKDPKAILHEVTLPFVTDNLRAVLTEVESERRGKKGSSGISPSGGPIEGKPDAEVSLSWKTNNPDEDKLRFRLEYQMLGSGRWYLLTRPDEVVTSDDYKWDTSMLPEGWYRVRVSASDELSNPPARATSHSLESGLVLVDNTAPVVRNLEGTGSRITGVAVDGVGPIQRIEASVVGSDEWYPFEPEDGILDEAAENFTVDLGFLKLASPVVVVVRVFDDAGNSVIRHVSLSP